MTTTAAAFRVWQPVEVLWPNGRGTWTWIPATVTGTRERARGDGDLAAEDAGVRPRHVRVRVTGPGRGMTYQLPVGRVRPIQAGAGRAPLAVAGAD